MNIDEVYRRYQKLQAWVGWTDECARRVAARVELLTPHLPALIDDFCDDIERQPHARKVITGGQAQIQRLKGTLIQWLRDLLSGRYDREHVARAIVEKNGGTLRAPSEPGRSSTFTVFLQAYANEGKQES